jgi:hypothetical protein
MAAIQGKNVRNSIGKTMFSALCVDTIGPFIRAKIGRGLFKPRPK